MSAGGTPEGWYPDVERPGGERYWDGTAWTEHRRAAGGADPTGQGFGGSVPTQGYGSPPAYGQSPGYQAPSYPAPGAQTPWNQPPSGYQPYGAFGRTYAKSSKAGLALGLSIGGLLCCGLIAIAGVIMGRKEMNDVDAGLVDPSSRGLAKAAFIVGVVGLVLWAALFAFYAIMIAAFSTTG